MLDDQASHSGELRRISPYDLQYPVLIIRRNECLRICHDADSLGPLVSARGHFEVPQGLPDLSRAESVAELFGVLLNTGFR